LSPRYSDENWTCIDRVTGVISGIGKGVIGTCALESAHNVRMGRRGEGRLIENSLFYRSAAEDDRA
jgi:hypothetical protein